MRRSRTVWSVVAIMLAACLPQVIGEARWYVGVGAGGNWMPGMRQVGHNRDGTCYPNDDCTGVAVDGYRVDGIRVELSASQRKNRLEQRFRSIAYRDGSAIADDPSSPYRSSSRASIDALRTRTLMLSAYRDFPLAGTAFTPYLGVGAGVSRAEVKGLYFRSRYSCAADCDAGPPERYDSWQQDDMSEHGFRKGWSGALDGIQASDEPAQARRDRTGVKRHRGDTRETQGRAVAVLQEGMPFRSEGAMRKSDIAVQVAGRTPLTKAQAKSAVKAVFEVIREALANRDTVTITGFGRFSTKSRPARTGRNPRTGETVAIAASKAPSFKAGRSLRERLR